MADFNPSNTIDSQLANLPPEYAEKIAKLLRSQQMSQMGMQMGLQGLNAPTQFTGGPANYAVKKSPLATLAQGLQVYLGQKGISDADAGIAGVKKDAADFRTKGVQEMLGMTDPNAQVSYGRASNDPYIQKLAETLAKQRQEQGTQVSNVLKDTDQTAAIAAAMGTMPGANYKPPEQAPVVFGQQGEDRYALISQPGGKRDFKWAPRPPQVNVDNAGELAATKALGGKVPEVMEKARNDIIEGNRAIDNAGKIIQLARDPQTIAGFGANVQLGLSSLGAKFGFTGPDAAAKTQQLLGLFAKNTLEASKDLKGSITEKEYPFLEAASSGSITWTPEALQHLAAMAYAVNHNKVLNATAQYNGTASMPGAENSAKMYPFPGVNHTTPPGLDFAEDSRGRLSYTGILKNPNPSAAPAGGGIKPPKLDPNKIYTLEELKKLGVL